jgi:hypothetical protein
MCHFAYVLKALELAVFGLDVALAARKTAYPVYLPVFRRNVGGMSIWERV